MAIDRAKGMAISSVVLLIIGAVLCLAAVGANTWLKHKQRGGQMGIFQKCGRSADCYEQWARSLPEWWLASQAFIVLGLMCFIAALIFSPFYFCGCCSQKCLTSDLMAAIIALLMLVAFGCILICVVVFGIKADREYELSGNPIKFGWGYVMAILAGLIALVVGILVILIRSRRHNPNILA